MSQSSAEGSPGPVVPRLYRRVIGDRLKSSSAGGAPPARIAGWGVPSGAGLLALSQWRRWVPTDRESLVRSLRVAVPALVFAGSFLVYLLTMAPTVYGWDAAEFAATAYNLGVPHATGYPLYVLLGKLFTYIPVGDVAYRLNLMSAFFASGAVTLTYLISYLVTRRMVLSIAAAGALAFSYFFWVSAVVTEVYSLHAFLNAATIYLLLLWRRDGRDRLLYAGVFIWGLSFGNHMTTALMGPAIAVLLALGLWERRINLRHALPLAVCFLAPLSIYAYLPLRYLAEAEPWVISQYTAEGVLVRTNPTTFEGMWEILTARQFDTLFLAHLQESSYLDELKELMFIVYANFLGAGLVLGMLGIARNFLVDKERLVFLGLIFLANLLFFADYGAVDKYFMFVTPMVVWAIWMAEGLYLTFTSIEKALREGWPDRLKGTAGRWARRVRWEGLSLLLVVGALWVNFSYADVSSVTHVRDNYTVIMHQFEQDALVFAWWPDMAPMQYLQHVEGLRPDVQLIDMYLITPENKINLIHSSVAHRPVYMFGAHLGHLPFEKFEDPALKGSLETGYRIVAPLAGPPGPVSPAP